MRPIRRKRSNGVITRRVGSPIPVEMFDQGGNMSSFRIIGESFYTCIPDVAYPVPPEIREWLHSFDPSAIFMWRKQRYYMPNSSEAQTYVHHAVGKWHPNPPHRLRLFHVEMPMDACHPQPNMLLHVWERLDDPVLLCLGGPGAYMPWDGKIVRWLETGNRSVMRPVEELIDEDLKKHLATFDRAGYARADQDAAFQQSVHEFMQRRGASHEEWLAASKEYEQRVLERMANRGKTTVTVPELSH